MSSARRDNDVSIAANRSLWDAWTAIHAGGDFYDLERFKAGGVRIRHYEIEMIGDVSGKSLLHLQDATGKWRLPPGAAGELPLMFSLLATNSA